MLPNWRFSLLLLPLPLLVAAVYIVPSLLVVRWSFTEPQLGIDQYIRIATDPVVQTVLLRTLRICLFAVTIAVVLAYMLAYQMVFGSPMMQAITTYFIMVPFWISVLVRTFGWLVLLRNNGLINETLMGAGIISEPLPLVRNELGSLIGIIHYLIPFAVFPIASSLRQIDKSTLRAACALGASRSRIFWQITVPLSASAIIGSVVITAIFTLGFFITPAILSGGRSVMVSEYIYLQLFQTVNWGLASALSVVIIVAVATIAIVMRRFLKLGTVGG